VRRALTGVPVDALGDRPRWAILRGRLDRPWLPSVVARWWFTGCVAGRAWVRVGGGGSISDEAGGRITPRRRLGKAALPAARHWSALGPAQESADSRITQAQSLLLIVQVLGWRTVRSFVGLLVERQGREEDVPAC
jgi:hypothetical protein